MQQSLRCCAAYLNYKSLRIRDPSCIEFGNEFWGFPVNTGFSYPTVSVFITRTYSSPIIAWFVPCVVPAGWTAGLENAEYGEERRLLLPVVPCHGSFSMLYAHHAMKSWIYRHRSHRMLTPPRFLTTPLKWMVEMDWNDLSAGDIMVVKLGQGINIIVLHFCTWPRQYPLVLHTPTLSWFPSLSFPRKLDCLILLIIMNLFIILFSCNKLFDDKK